MFFFFSEGLKPPTSHEMSQKNTAGKHHCSLGRLGHLTAAVWGGSAVKHNGVIFVELLELTTQRGLK